MAFLTKQAKRTTRPTPCFGSCFEKHQKHRQRNTGDPSTHRSKLKTNGCRNTSSRTPAEREEGSNHRVALHHRTSGYSPCYPSAGALVLYYGLRSTICPSLGAGISNLNNTTDIRASPSYEYAYIPFPPGHDILLPLPQIDEKLPHSAPSSLRPKYGTKAPPSVVVSSLRIHIPPTAASKDCGTVPNRSITRRTL